MTSSPESYNTLPFQHIRTSHVPSYCHTVTPVILITLHRPGAHNAFTNLMASELVSIFHTLHCDSRVRAIVVTGHGNVFCAGADLKAGFNYPGTNMETYRDTGGQVALAIHNCAKPVIAAINGLAIGVGLTMTLPMTLRITSPATKISLPFTRLGLNMEASSSYFLPRLIGFSRALQLITTGTPYRADHPALAQLFNELVATPEEVLPRALAIADDIARNTSLVSWVVMRDLMWRGSEGRAEGEGGAERAHVLESKMLWDMFEGRDARDGVGAWRDGRKGVRGKAFEGTMERGAPREWPWWEGKVDVEEAEKGVVKKKSKL